MRPQLFLRLLGLAAVANSKFVPAPPNAEDLKFEVACGSPPHDPSAPQEARSCSDDHWSHKALVPAVWRHAGGGFENIEGASWREDDGGMVSLYYTEVERDNLSGRVVLFDKNRQLNIILTKGMSYMQFPNQHQTALFQGNWVPLAFLLNEDNLHLHLASEDKGRLWGHVTGAKLREHFTVVGDKSNQAGLLLQPVDGAEGERPLWITGDGDAYGYDGERAAWEYLGRGKWLPSPRQDLPELREISPRIINPGKRIALLTLSTPNIAEYAKEAEKNQRAYAERHEMTFIVYDDSIVEWDQDKGSWYSIVTWNKIRAVMEHLSHYDYVIWIDSDAIFLQMEKPFQEIIATQADKGLLVCDDPKDWMLNTGVMVFKNIPWTHEMLERLWGMPKVTHSSGAEQNQLIKLLTHLDNSRNHWHLFDECVFNCHPSNVVEGQTFLVHYMGMGTSYKTTKIREDNTKLGIL